MPRGRPEKVNKKEKIKKKNPSFPGWGGIDRQEKVPLKNVEKGGKTHKYTVKEKPH